MLAGPQLRDHPGGRCSARDEPLHRARLDHGYGCARVVQHPGRGSGDHQTPRTQARGQMARECIGVDVEQPAVPAQPDGRDHGHEPSADERGDRTEVGLIARNPDPAQIDRPAVHGAGRRRGLAETAPAVGTRQPDRRSPRGRERRDEPGVDRPSQDGDHDVQRRVVRDPEAVHLTLLDARGLERRVDLLAAPVDDHQRRAGLRPNAGRGRAGAFLRHSGRRGAAPSGDAPDRGDDTLEP